jgi:preprotein translocase subunit SecA
MALDNKRIEGRFDRKREEKERIKKALPTEEEPQLPPPVETIHADKDKQTGRNDPCPCGSGKKYKKCCGK